MAGVYLYIYIYIYIYIRGQPEKGNGVRKRDAYVWWSK
jgi:hypothetical protein